MMYDVVEGVRVIFLVRLEGIWRDFDLRRHVDNNLTCFGMFYYTVTSTRSCFLLIKCSFSFGAVQCQLGN